jgi:hypothetical protein
MAFVLGGRHIIKSVHSIIHKVLEWQLWTDWAMAQLKAPQGGSNDYFAE